MIDYPMINNHFSLTATVLFVILIIN